MQHHRKILTLLVFLILACVCLLGCGSHAPAEPVAKAASPTPSPRSSKVIDSEPDETEPNSDEDSDEAEGEETAETNDDESSEGGYFHGRRCTVDCSGHEAGYEWAEEYDIHDPDDCGGNSESFIEGCQIYAEENP